MDRTTLLAEIQTLVAGFTGLEPEAIGPEAHVQNDLGLDSLNLVQLLTELTRRHGLEVRIDRLTDLDRMMTVGGLTDTLLALAGDSAEVHPS
ncbi:acyl carrier protein [Streptomyces lunalinharesii]|uniref:Carrier domain-containing protein n=1 Tax=Streptomyces lunalinharesii TaxID=333384 RepID=A0ABP6EY55_9ACTN